jgi:hypothetical protein
MDEAFATVDSSCSVTAAIVHSTTNVEQEECNENAEGENGVPPVIAAFIDGFLRALYDLYYVNLYDPVQIDIDFDQLFSGEKSM